MEVANIQNLRNKTQDYLYLASRIVLPIATMILLASIIAEKVELIDNVVFSFIKVNIEGNEVFTYKAVKGIIVFVILFFIYRGFIKKESKTFGENVIGDFATVFYRLAACLGYENVSLVHKSIPLQFYLLDSRIFKEYQANESGVIVIDNKDVTYKKEEIEGDARELNIGIFDSYAGDKSLLPDRVKTNKTIILIPERKDNEAKRFYSEALVNSLNQILRDNSTTKKFNLFTFTNPVTNRKIYENVFNTKNDNYNLRVYYYDQRKKEFEDKFIEIKP